MAARDQQDSTRKESPLKQASDAIFIDTTNLSMKQQDDLIFSIINEKINNEHSY